MSGHENNTCPKCEGAIDPKTPGTCASCGATCPVAKKKDDDKE
jgi:hypothetical protein